MYFIYIGTPYYILEIYIFTLNFFALIDKRNQNFFTRKILRNSKFLF